MKKLNYKVSPKITPEDLMKQGFHRVYPSVYIYRTPGYKHNKQPLIFLEFIVNYEVNNKKELINPTMSIHCKDRNDNPYIPFYREDYFNKNLVLEKVKRKMSLVINDLVKKEILFKLKNTKKGKNK